MRSSRGAAFVNATVTMRAVATASEARRPFEVEKEGMVSGWCLVLVLVQCWYSTNTSTILFRKDEEL